MKVPGLKINVTFIVIAVTVLLLLVGLAWYFYRQGKKTATGPVVKFEEGTAALPAGWSPVPLADELHDVMDGLFTLSGTKSKTWQKLYDLPTNDMVRAVYSAFNQKYFNKGKGTLTQWIRDENYYDYTTGIKEQVLNRLAQLNLA